MRSDLVGAMMTTEGVRGSDVPMLITNIMTASLTRPPSGDLPLDHSVLRTKYQTPDCQHLSYQPHALSPAALHHINKLHISSTQYMTYHQGSPLININTFQFIQIHCSRFI